MINTPKIYKMRIVFRWSAPAADTRDVPAVLRQLVVDSGLAYVPCKPGSPVPRLSYGPSAAKGIITEREYADIYVYPSVSASEVAAKLTEKKPSGFTLLQVVRVPYALAGVQQLASAAVYRVEGPFSAYTPVTAETYFNAPRVEVTRRAANGMTFSYDAKPYVQQVKTLGPQTVQLTLACVHGKWMSPQTLVGAWLGTDPAACDNIRLIRESLLWQDTAGAYHLI